jgi:hypothetical protein
LVLVVARVRERDRAAHAVPEQEQRTGGMPLANQAPKRLEVGGEVREPLDVGAPAAGPPVPAVVECVDRIAARHDVVDEIAIPPRVFGEAVRDVDHRARRGVGQPALPEEVGRPDAGEDAVDVHG